MGPECVHLIFKVYFAGFALIFANLTVQYQLTVCLVSLIAYSAVSAQLQAYKHVADDFLWNACLSCLFISMCAHAACLPRSTSDVLVVVRILALLCIWIARWTDKRSPRPRYARQVRRTAAALP